MIARAAAVVALLLVAMEAAASYVGVGACASRTCHGGETPHAAVAVRHDEYRVWSTLDPHRRAYAALLSPRGTAIARRLGIDERGTWPKRDAGRRACLGCHALVPEGVVGTATEDDWLADGVGCEACHGPAAGWLRTHTATSRPGSLHAGMVETMAPARAADACVRCHVGTASLRVDHRLLAAGHPPLVFDLDYFARNMPRHWTVHEGNARWGTTEPLRAGAATAIRARDALGGRDRGWPEFSQFDCGACHHDWASGREPAGRVLGHPSPDASTATVLAMLGREDAPAGIARALVDAAPRLSAHGHLTALHAYWAVDDAVRRGGTPSPDLERALSRLECDVRRPATYDPARFARHLRALGPLLP